MRPWVAPCAALIMAAACVAPLRHTIKNAEIPAVNAEDSSDKQSSSTPVLMQDGDVSFDDVKDKRKQIVYVNKDVDVKSGVESVSATVETVKQGEKVSLMDVVSGTSAEILTGNGKVGYVPTTVLATDKRSVFKNENKTMYIARDKTELKKSPYQQGTSQASLNKNDEVKVTGTNESGFTRVVSKGKTGYVASSSLMEHKDIPKPTPQPAKTVDTPRSAPAVNTWNGRKLSPSAGSVIGPSGKETYYNLNMAGCVNVMRRMGNNDAYWVRCDGVKMLGSYVMCAANLTVHPRGSIVQSSVGPAIVVDTGGFAANDPNQLDIAVTW